MRYFRSIDRIVYRLKLVHWLHLSELVIDLCKCHNRTGEMKRSTKMCADWNICLFFWSQKIEGSCINKFGWQVDYSFLSSALPQYQFEHVLWMNTAKLFPCTHRNPFGNGKTSDIERIWIEIWYHHDMIKITKQPIYGIMLQSNPHQQQLRNEKNVCFTLFRPLTTAEHSRLMDRHDLEHILTR